MANHDILDSKTHNNTKVITSYDQKFTDKNNSALIFPTEFKEAQRDYPILFIKNPETGQFQSVVLFGLVSDENLFVTQGNNNGWQASYIPAMVTKGPFIIGFEDKEVNGEMTKQPIIGIDMDNPRVNNELGEPIFLENEQPSPYLHKVNNALKTIHEGAQVNTFMFEAFLKYELIEPVALNIELNNGEKISLEGNYTINESKLAALSGDALTELHTSGLLRLAYFVNASLGNIQRLIDFKNNAQG